MWQLSPIFFSTFQTKYNREKNHLHQSFHGSSYIIVSSSHQKKKTLNSICTWFKSRPNPKCWTPFFHSVSKLLYKVSFSHFIPFFFWQFFSWNQSCQQLKRPKPQHFHEFFTQKSIIFSGNQSWIFGQKWRFWTVWLIDAHWLISDGVPTEWD